MIPAVAIPALVALVFKLGLFGYSARLPNKNVTTYVLLALLLAFTLHSLIEVVGFYLFTGTVTLTMERVGIAYIASLILAGALVLHASLRVSNDISSDALAWFEGLIYVPAIILIYFLLATDLLVAGFQSFHNTMLRIPGPLYFSFEVYLPCYILASVAALLYGAWSSKRSAVMRARSRLWLLALLPLAIMLGYLIIANHYGVARITSTIYTPIPWLVFLAVATLATHHHRLLDLAFYVPGSKVRRRKNALYTRIRSLSANVEQVRGNQEFLHELATTLGCSIVLVQDQSAAISASSNDDVLFMSRFPFTELRGVAKIVIAEEIKNSDPRLYAFMARYRVGAIAPFGQETGKRWLLFGERFREEFYTPLDFRHLEELFERIGHAVFDDLQPLRSELKNAIEDLRKLRNLLGRRWNELADLRRRLELDESDNRRLRDSLVSEEKQETISDEIATLEQYLVERENAVVRAALSWCAGDRLKAARLLGISLKALEHFEGRGSVS